MNPKVSIVTPCYNSEKFIKAYLQSILNQTYTNLEVILVDDGSTDNTALFIEEYRDYFEEKRIVYHYLYQNHCNQACAINYGLKYVTGDYLIWPDSDDILEPDSIEKRVAYLQSHVQTGMVRSGYYFINAVTKKNFHEKQYYYEDNSNIFYDLFFEKCPVYCGTYMIRMDCFDKINPMREIEIGHGGQNYQILLPMAYYYKCGYIKNRLYGITIHEDSHSRKIRTYEQAMDRMESLIEICDSVLDNLPIDKENKNYLMKMKKNQCYRIVDKLYGRIGIYIWRTVLMYFDLFIYNNLYRRTDAK